MASKKDTIEQTKANLPKPEDPPVASDFHSSDPSKTSAGIGSGGISGGLSSGAGSSTLRGPATIDSSEVGGGRQAKDGLGGLPNDAVTKEAKGKSGLADTTGKDYGYPAKSDPSSGI